MLVLGVHRGEEGGYTYPGRRGGHIGRYTPRTYREVYTLEIYTTWAIHHPGYTTPGAIPHPGYTTPGLYHPGYTPPWLYTTLAIPPPGYTTPWLYPTWAIPHLGYTPGLPSLRHPFHCWSSLLRHPFHCWSSLPRHLSERKYPESSKRSKDTRMVNEKGTFARFDRFDKRGDLMRSGPFCSF